MPRGVPVVNELSAAAEDCLKAIYKFAGHGGAAAIHELAPHLLRLSMARPPNGISSRRASPRAIAPGTPISLQCEFPRSSCFSAPWR